MHHGVSWGRAIWPEGTWDAEDWPMSQPGWKVQGDPGSEANEHEPLISDETTSRVDFITGQWQWAERHPVTRVGDVAAVTVNMKPLPEQAIGVCRFHLSSWPHISCWYPFRPQINKVCEQVPAFWEEFTLRARSPFPGSCLQPPKLEADKVVHPKQQAPAHQDRLHPFPSQPLLPCQLLPFQLLHLHFIMTCWEDLSAKHKCSENVNRRPSRHRKINRIVVRRWKITVCLTSTFRCKSWMQEMILWSPQRISIHTEVCIIYTVKTTKISDSPPSAWAVMVQLLNTSSANTALVSVLKPDTVGVEHLQIFLPGLAASPHVLFLLNILLK